MADLEEKPPPPLIVYVNAFWFLSITLSLGASTWAMLCQEWCASHLQGGQPGDYVEMATKRQRTLEAIKKWKMETLVTSIPIVLHLALFLFLAGLSLRLVDKNRVLGFVVGIPAAIIITTYIVSTLLPVFTDAPFHTSASELTGFVHNRFKQFPQIIWPLVSNLPWGDPPFPQRIYHRTVMALKRLITPIIAGLKYIHQHSAPPIFSIWQRIFPFLPQFKFQEGGVLGELNRLVIDLPEQNSMWRGRALFWLLQMPLNREEFSTVLKELDKIPRGGDSYAVDQQSIEPLTLCLSSVLSDGHISPEEEPVTRYCVRVLARALDYAFFVHQNRELIILTNETISKTLDQFLDKLAGDHGSKLEDLIVPLWFCPTKSRIQKVVESLDKDADGISRGLLTSAVHGLHAAMLSLLKSKKPITELYIPDILSWDRKIVLKDLGHEISAYLHDLFVALCESSGPWNKTAPLQTLVIESLQHLDGDEGLSQTLLNPLCAFIIVEKGISSQVATAILHSIKEKSRSTPITEMTLVQLANKLKAIAGGSPIPSGFQPLIELRSIFDYVTKGKNGGGNNLAHFVQWLFNAYISTISNTNQHSDADISFFVEALQNQHNEVAVREHGYHLSLLHSLIDVFPQAKEPWSIIRALYQLGEFFGLMGGKGDHVDQVMDTFFNAAVLQAMHYRNLNGLEAKMKGKEKEQGKGKGKEEVEVEMKEEVEVEMKAIGGAKKALSWLKTVLFTENSQIRWKGICLLVELAGVIDGAELELACNHIRSEINDRIQPARAGELLADLDPRLREGLRLCKLEAIMSLPSSSLDYHGKGKIPLLPVPGPKAQMVHDQSPTDLQRFGLY